ncbi:MAG: YraN family protein [Betaproteobacteria bacterium]
MNPDGERAEDAALAFLEARGLRLRARNYRSRFGEIDLVLEDHGTLVFVEVRKRSNPRFGGAAESITHAKRERLVATARQYLAALKRETPCRFDAVLLDAGGTVEWIRAAFES